MGDMAGRMKGGIQLNRTETGILRFLLGNMPPEFSIKAISEGTGQGYAIVRKNVLGLEKKGMVKIRKINPTQYLCSIDKSNGDNVPVLSCIEFIVAAEFFSRRRDLKAAADDILKRVGGNSFTMMLFGSVVSGKDRPDSDIDVLFLLASMKDEGRVMNAVSGASRLTNREIHAIAMTYGDFFASLGKKEACLAKEVLNKHITVYGAEAFYRVLVAHEQQV